jgi:hypothetical protein
MAIALTPRGGTRTDPTGERLLRQMHTRQRLEEYAEIRTNVASSPELFDVPKWTTAPHWAP